LDITKAMAQFEQKGYTVSYFDRAQAATTYLDTVIRQQTVGFGDSATLSDMGLFQVLRARNEVFDPQNRRNGSSFLSTAKQCLTTDVYLTSVNALSETGELVNIDGTGNRLAGALFGHEKVFFVAGTNKLVATLDQAIWRARNVAAPKNAKRLGLRTPCASRADRCYDCSSPDRICNGMLVHFKAMDDMDMEIVLVDETLGF